MQTLRRRHGLHRVHLVGRADPRRGEIAQETRNRRRGTPRGHSDIRPPDRPDGRGGAHGRGGRSRRDRHQFRLPGEEDRRARSRVGDDARRAADGRDDAPDRRGGEEARDGENPPRMGRGVEKHRRDSPAVAGCRHCGPHHSRAHAGADVPRRGRLDADRQGEEQPADTHSDHRQRRRRFRSESPRDVRPLRRGRRDDRPGDLRPAVDIPRSEALPLDGRSAAAAVGRGTRGHREGTFTEIARNQG